MKTPLCLLPLLCLPAFPLAAQEEGNPAPEPEAPASAGEDSALAPPRALEPPPTRDPHEGLPQRENEIPLEFADADKDGDGRLSAAESIVVFPRSVVLVDLDEDGLLSRAEVRETLPNVEFEDQAAGDQPIGEGEYTAILEEVTRIVEEEAGIDPRGEEDVSLDLPG